MLSCHDCTEQKRALHYGQVREREAEQAYTGLEARLAALQQRFDARESRAEDLAQIAEAQADARGTRAELFALQARMAQQACRTQPICTCSTPLVHTSAKLNKYIMTRTCKRNMLTKDQRRPPICALSAILNMTGTWTSHDRYFIVIVGRARLTNRLPACYVKRDACDCILDSRKTA